ncbi:MAG: hypothetical protein JAZ11_13910 [Candidatus Thiodiazotropha lotti]|nr:hypothetical protein [Candidatus Thiodiazotropha lotti]
MKETESNNALLKIEKEVKDYARSHDAFLTKVDALQKELNEVRNQHRGALLSSAKALKDREISIRHLIEQNPKLFEKKKTRELHDVTFGYRKKPDTLVIKNQDETISLINKNYSAMERFLLNKRVILNRAALKSWTDQQLKTIKIKRQQGDNETVIKTQRGDILNLTAWLEENSERLS